MSLTVTDAVINFGNQTDRVTIKARLDNVPNSANVADFEIRIIVTDKRSLLQHDSGTIPPTDVK